MPELWELRKQLAQKLASSRLLYLDQRFWNDFCDVALNSSRGSEERDTLDALRVAVARERVCCPIESHVFLELYKQRLPEKRQATALLIDDLSRGVVILAPEERAFLETLRFVQYLTNAEPMITAPRDEVWTKAAYLLGHVTPHDPSLPPDVAKWVEDQFHGDLWNRGFSDILSELPDPPDPDMSWTIGAAERLNRGKVDARTRFRSYEALYDSELDGVLEAYSTSLADVSHYLFARAGHDPSTVTENQKLASSNGLRRVLAKAFRKQNLAAALPTFHITATLYSRMQWDATRAYVPNDFADFGHATAAFPYFDAFATERPLADLSRQAGLPALYGTVMLTTMAQLIDWLKASSSDPPTAV